MGRSKVRATHCAGGRGGGAPTRRWRVAPANSGRTICTSQRTHRHGQEEDLQQPADDEARRPLTSPSRPSSAPVVTPGIRWASAQTMPERTLMTVKRRRRHAGHAGDARNDRLDPRHKAPEADAHAAIPAEEILAARHQGRIAGQRPRAFQAVAPDVADPIGNLVAQDGPGADPRQHRPERQLAQANQGPHRTRGTVLGTNRPTISKASPMAIRKATMPASSGWALRNSTRSCNSSVKDGLSGYRQGHAGS